jgi:hypothetical protein
VESEAPATVIPPATPPPPVCPCPDGTGGGVGVPGYPSPQFAVFVDGDIGTTAQPYGSDIVGEFAATGSAYLKGFTGGLAGSNKQFSVSVGGDFQLSGGDIVGGGVQAGGSFALNQISVQGNVVAAGGGVSVVGGTVIGNVKASGNINAPDWAITGTRSASQQGLTLTYDLAKIANDYRTYSAALAGHAQNVAWSNNFGTISVTAATAGTYYITIDAATLQAASGLQVNLPAGSSLIMESNV